MRSSGTVVAVRAVKPENLRLIESEEDIRAGVRSLRRRCAVMKRIIDETGLPPLRRREPGFEGLARIIVGQQLSISSAAAIWNRFAAVFPGAEPAAVLTADDATLRAVGLSAPKIRALRAAAEAVVIGGLDLGRLVHASDAEIHERLTAVRGIGPWTADIFLMFCLGRADSFAAGDLALQIAVHHAFGLSERPKPLELLDIAERWRPWRGVAARSLWAWYPSIRKSAPAVPV
jgi:DNA-3-methyladenine glycosylase II